MYNFVFDVDGTLTPSRGLMDAEFKAWFKSWAEHKPVYLITGSDYPKTVEQVGRDLAEFVTGVYNCAGNYFYRQGVLESSRDWALTPEQEGYLKGLLAASTWPIKTGQHIDVRGGLVNFSTLGRGAGVEQRGLYEAWDRSNQERRKLALLIELEYPELSATVAGATGIDIYPRGWDKAQIADSMDNIVFFGDKTEQGGNDHSLAQRAQRVHAVTSWQDTQRILAELYVPQLEEAADASSS